MATFKMTIAEGTPLWNAIGGLSAKARNAEIYRLATTGLLSQNFGQHATAPAAANVVTQELVTRTPEKETIHGEDVAPQGGFLAVDFENDLKFLS